MLAALALPFELAYAIGLVGLLGRQQVIAYNVLRFLRRALLTVLLLSFVLHRHARPDARSVAQPDRPARHRGRHRLGPRRGPACSSLVG